MKWHTSLFLLLLCFLATFAHCKPGKEDYYKVFDLTRQSFDKDKLHRAYRKLAKQHHPDKNKGDKEAEARFVEITKAFEVLNDEEKRRIYDQLGADAVEKHMRGGGGGGGGAYDFRHAEDIFNSFFGGGFGGFGGGGFDDIFGFGGGGHRQQQKRRSPDAKLEMSAPLEAFYTGEKLVVEIGRQQLCKPCKGTGARDPDSVKTCDKCKGRGQETVVQQVAPGFIQQMQRPCSKCSGKGKVIKDVCKSCAGRRVFQGPSKIDVKVEPGMPDGATLRFPGMSDEHPDAEAGDLFVQVRQESHPVFRRNGPDLYTDLTLTLKEALLGFKRELAHLDKHKVTLSAPEGQVTQPDQVLTVKGEGMPIHGSKRKGDLYVKVKVVLPSSLDKSQTEALSKLLRSPQAKEDL